MKENSFIKYQLVLIFLVLIFIPGIFKITGLTEFDRRDENRQFKDKVKFDVARLDYFPAEVDSFTNDNFYFRSPFLDFFHRMKFFVFDISPHPDQTIIGKDGWYFIAGKELEILKGSRDFSPAALDSFANEWKERTDYFKELNIPVFWMVAPMKHHVYSEKLPYNVYQSEKNRTTILKEYLKPHFPDLIIDPLEKLKASKGKKELYFRLDNHWNLRGGYITTQLIIDQLKETFPDKNVVGIPALSWKEETIQNGIHYRVMGIDELEERIETPVFKNPQSKEVEKYGFKAPEGFGYPENYEKRYVNEKLKNGLRVLFIRDSYAEAIMPFAREVFSESLFIFDAWQYKLNKEIVESFKPDVVIFLGLETHVENYIKKYDLE